MRRTKTTQGQYLTQADPTLGEPTSVWGVPVLTTTQIAAGAGVLMDTKRMGRVYIREPLSLRMGWAANDFTSNIVRWVCEQRRSALHRKAGRGAQHHRVADLMISVVVVDPFPGVRLGHGVSPGGARRGARRSC